MFDKLIHYMMRAEIYFMGFRRTNIIAVENALKHRGIKGALTYSRKDLIMILNQDETITVHKNNLAKNQTLEEMIYDELWEITF